VDPDHQTVLSAEAFGQGRIRSLPGDPRPHGGCMITNRIHCLAAFTMIASAAVLALPVPATASVPGPECTRPTTYVVSQEPGVLPESIAITADGTMYVTGAGNGAVYRGSVHESRMQPFIPAGADGRQVAAGVHVDRWGRILVAGYRPGKLYLYDARARLLAVRDGLPTSTLNDFTFTADAVYVTDSANDLIWRAPLTRDGLGELKPWLDLDDRLGEQEYFLNGIVTTGDRRYLLVSAQGTDQTFRLGLADRRTVQVAMHGADGLLSADGMLLEGHRLYAAFNYSDGKGSWLYVIRLVELNRDWTQARFIADSEVLPRSVTTTSVARDGDRLLTTRSQLGGNPPTPPYLVTEVNGLR
jgi:sugar lactone lactonase YvrE